MLVQFPLFVVWDEMYMAAGRDKLGGRLATQFCKRHFGGKKYHILMFCTKIASIFEFIVQGGFFNWPSPENVSRLAPPQNASTGPPLLYKISKYGG